MFFRTPRFIRRWIRRRMHPMAEHKAMDVRQKLSYLYVFFAWNAFGFVMYQLVQGNKHWPVTYGLRKENEEDLTGPSYQYAKLLGIQQAEVFSLSYKGGLQQMKSVDLAAEEKSKGQQETEELIN